MTPFSPLSDLSHEVTTPNQTTTYQGLGSKREQGRLAGKCQTHATQMQGTEEKQIANA